MVYDQYARVLFPGRQLLTFLEVHVSEEGFPGSLGHPHGSRHCVGRFDFVSYYVHQRFPASSYAEYEQSSSSSGDDQPPSPQQQVQQTILNRLIRTRRPREASGLLEPTAAVSAQGSCLCPPQIYFQLPRTTVNSRSLEPRRDTMSLSLECLEDRTSISGPQARTTPERV
ncbi:hypothetical protein Efla_001886 [Eimeria flavescens]